MKLYTRGGDKGETALRGRGRVSKDDPRMIAIGDLDELNAFIGLCLTHLPTGSEPVIAETLSACQSDLFDIGAELADVEGRSRLTPDCTTRLEEAIDLLVAGTPPLKHFVLPGGHVAAVYLHVARTVARRAERQVVRLRRDHPANPVSLAYLNRISDFLFAAARHVNTRKGASEPIWPGDTSSKGSSRT